MSPPRTWFDIIVENNAVNRPEKIGNTFFMLLRLGEYESLLCKQDQLLKIAGLAAHQSVFNWPAVFQLVCHAFGCLDRFRIVKLENSFLDVLSVAVEYFHSSVPLQGLFDLVLSLKIAP
ncbi:hypothetical protein L1987_63491 [Smallanthus sonchifolius]|uniref:Uncharacterized protein n=1 Tax=Smallanthus sonchifolius TaxID=185202 RepID=A0ACB9CDA5_9ASTR|nr:hypothetical protein L1987_63491 [Smallanthus sonchifolius]